MKILWVKSGKLLPLDSGGKLRTYNILRHLTAHHQVTTLTYYDGLPDPEYEWAIAEHLPGAVTVQTGVPQVSGLRRVIDYTLTLPGPTPFAVVRYASPLVGRMISEWISKRRFDVAVCDFLASTPNFPQNLATPTALFQHNVETVLWQRRFEFASTPLRRLISKIEFTKMDRYETLQVRRFHRVLAVSADDRKAMSSMTDPSRISVIPTGVDLSKYRYDPQVRPSSPLVVFTGSMDWEPNIDGVEYFCKDVWPAVLAEIPDAHFRIVGRDPHPRVKRLASPSVEVTGTVPSIVDHVRQAAVLVVPLRMGGGTRIKIYEGLAMGKATVTTTVGAEGLDVRHGHDILLADEAKQFAECIVQLLRNEARRQELGAAAAATAQRYDWSVIAARFVEELHRTIENASPADAIPEQMAAAG